MVTLVISVILFIPTVDCGIMSRSGKDDKKCMPEIVAIKKTRIVPVAVPVKSMSGPGTVTTYTEEVVADPKDIYKPKEKPKEKDEKDEKSKYEEEDEHEPAVAEAPVYSADDDEEEDEEHYEEDSAVTDNVDGGSAYTVSGGEDDEYKRRKDQLTTTPKPKHRAKRQVSSDLNRKKKKKSNRHKHKNKSHSNKVKVSSSLTSPFSSDGTNKIRGVIRESLTAILSQTRGHLDAALSRSFMSPIPLRPPIDFLPSKVGQNLFDKIRKVSSRVTQNYYPQKDLDDWTAEEIAGFEQPNDQEATSRQSKNSPDADSYADQQESREITKILSSFPQSDRLLIEEEDESEF